MTDKTSLAEHYALHTSKEKGMGMNYWGREVLGLISQRSKVHHLENNAHIASRNQIINQIV